MHFILNKNLKKSYTLCACVCFVYKFAFDIYGKKNIRYYTIQFSSYNKVYIIIIYKTLWENT